MTRITLRRVYDKDGSGEGLRVLVDRLWPRGLSKDDLKIDVWARDIAPSSQLRRWYSHDPGKWVKFKEAYWKELESKEEEVKAILDQAHGRSLTLLYAAKDRERNNAVVLREFILKLESPV